MLSGVFQGVSASVLSRRACSPARYMRRNIMDTGKSDVLLGSADLAKVHHAHLTEVSKEHFAKEFGNSPVKGIRPEGDHYFRRLAVTLPLEISSGNVIPIPFILDTRAPSIMNLGVGAMKKLREKGLIYEDATIRLLGKLLWREKSIDKPVVNTLPHYYEGSMEGDVRLNLLGLKGMGKLQIVWDWENIPEI